MATPHPLHPALGFSTPWYLKGNWLWSLAPAVCGPNDNILTLFSCCCLYNLELRHKGRKKSQVLPTGFSGGCFLCSCCSVPRAAPPPLYSPYCAGPTRKDMDQGCVNFSSGFAKTNIYFEGWWWEGLAYPHFVWDGKKVNVGAIERFYPVITAGRAGLAGWRAGGGVGH